MAIAAPSDEVIRLVEALGLRTKNTREVTLRMAVNEVVAVNTVEYVNGEQIDALAAELKERQYRLARWIPVEERLPDEYETVLVATDGGVSAGEIRFPDSECGMTEPWWMVFKDRREPSPAWAGLVQFAGVTHWMPLPEPPEVK